MSVLGYYMSDSKFGLFYKEARNFAPIYRASAFDFKTSEMSEQQTFRAFRLALEAAGKYRRMKIVLALNWGRWSSDKDALKGVELVAAAGLWSRVIAIELDDEPGWKDAKAQHVVETVDGLLSEMQLPRPSDGFGVVQHEKGVFKGGWRAMDWVGLEAYVSPPGSSNPKSNRSVLTKSMKRQVEELAGKPFVWVLQGYDRNGGWKNMRTLAALQADTFALMRQKRFKTALPWVLIFAYGRPGGTRDHPMLRETHRAYVFGTRI